MKILVSVIVLPLQIISDPQINASLHWSLSWHLPSSRSHAVTEHGSEQILSDPQINSPSHSSLFKHRPAPLPHGEVAHTPKIM